MSNAHFVEAIERIGGMYGSAFKDGVELLDAVEVGGATDIQRIDMPMVGRTRVGYKPGRESSEGTLRIQKFDAMWEMFVYKFLSQSLAERRAQRGTQYTTNRIFNLVLVEPGKSFVRVIQSIGRGLRKADDKEAVEIFDVSSKCKFSNRHLLKRKKFYDSVEYPYTVAKINY